MKKIFILLIGCLFWSACSEIPEDPYLRNDPDFPVQIRSVVSPEIYAIFEDRSRFWGSFYSIDNLVLKQTANVGELEVSFFGGCARHRWTLYAEDIYEDRQNPDEPLDILLYLFHGQEQDDCSDDQNHTFRTLDLSFLAAGLYNITIENTFDRNQLFFPGYEVR